MIKFLPLRVDGEIFLPVKISVCTVLLFFVIKVEVFLFLTLGYYVRQASSVGLALLLAYLSIPVVQNLLSSKQMMNTSFDSLKIVNTYGAFGR
jgi:membrane protein implicated in regulation of membrane protease activity